MESVTFQPEPPLPPRIGDAERDEAVALLQEHMTAGRLDSTEFNDRLGIALQARTQHELLPLFADLPGRRPGDPVPPPAPVLPVSNAADVERRQQIGAVVMGSLWPIALILCFATSSWWIMLIPIFMSGAIGQVFGMWSNDDRRNRRGHLGR